MRLPPKTWTKDLDHVTATPACILHVLDYLGSRDMYMYARMKQTYHILELHAEVFT